MVGVKRLRRFAWNGLVVMSLLVLVVAFRLWKRSYSEYQNLSFQVVTLRQAQWVHCSTGISLDSVRGEYCFTICHDGPKALSARALPAAFSFRVGKQGKSSTEPTLLCISFDSRQTG